MLRRAGLSMLLVAIAVGLLPRRSEGQATVDLACTIASGIFLVWPLGTLMAAPHMTACVIYYYEKK